MRPILPKEVDAFLKRFTNFTDSEFRHVEIVSPTTINITLAGQDSARGFDWISIELEFSDVKDARLLESSKLSHVDMSEGINIFYENGSFVFGVGNSTTTSSMKNSVSFIESSSLKYEEGSF